MQRFCGESIASFQSWIGRTISGKTRIAGVRSTPPSSTWPTTHATSSAEKSWKRSGSEWMTAGALSQTMKSTCRFTRASTSTTLITGMALSKPCLRPNATGGRPQRRHLSWASCRIRTTRLCRGTGSLSLCGNCVEVRNLFMLIFNFISVTWPASIQIFELLLAQLWPQDRRVTKRRY